MLGNSFGCQVAVELAVGHPDRVAGLALVGPTMDPSARTAPRQILRWLWDTAREDPLQLPITGAGPRRPSQLRETLAPGRVLISIRAHQDAASHHFDAPSDATALRAELCRCSYTASERGTGARHPIAEPVGLGGEGVAWPGVLMRRATPPTARRGRD
jgi:pimeloyl-ACP methyl ester carboxylesterase